MSGPILRWIRPSLNKPALPSWQCQLVHMVHFLESHNVWSHICAFPQLGENIFLRIIIIFINLHFFHSISSIFKLNIVVLMPCLMSISILKNTSMSWRDTDTASVFFHLLTSILQYISDINTHYCFWYWQQHWNAPS